LTGSEEVLALPPGARHRPTPQAQGQALFQIADGALSFDYKLIASNIDNIIMAHIHCGQAGTNGNHRGSIRVRRRAGRCQAAPDDTTVSWPRGRS
jgi:hypothetical protein